jgi:TPR repeat protein
VGTFVLYLALLFVSTAQAEAMQQTPLPEQQLVVPKLDPVEVSELRARAEHGDATAEYALGKAYESGNGVPQNEEAAVKWYRKAAEQGNAPAQNDLGIMYRTGQGVNRDKEQAVRWYRKAAKQGNPQALFNLGVSYYNGDGIPSDPSAAYSWFLLAEEAGNPAAKDAVKRSADAGGRLGTPDAMQHIAAMYEKGDELPQNYSEAAKWYRRAADMSPEAGVRLAEMLIDGKSVPQDYGQAVTLCRSAAKKNYSPGQCCVGYLYQHGLGVEANPKEAAKWYREASTGGSRVAMTSLADMYWKGDGVGVDRPEAYYYLFLASRGMPEAKTRAALLWKEMSKDDIKHLERKLRDLHFEPKSVFEFMQNPDTPRHR